VLNILYKNRGLKKLVLVMWFGLNWPWVGSSDGFCVIIVESFESNIMKLI